MKREEILIIRFNVNSLHSLTQMTQVVRQGKKKQTPLNVIYNRYTLDSKAKIYLKSNNGK